MMVISSRGGRYPPQPRRMKESLSRLLNKSKRLTGRKGELTGGKIEDSDEDKYHKHFCDTELFSIENFQVAELKREMFIKHNTSVPLYTAPHFQNMAACPK